MQEGIVYHVYNRGTEKRIIYKNDRDYARFIEGMARFNETRKAGENTGRLVDVVCFCLMPNHFHLLLRLKKEKGITDFMRRLSTGYTMYFNKKYGRQGVLFESNYKFQKIEDDASLLQVSRYIHLNPLSLIDPEWKEKGLKDTDEAMNFLEGYRWSNYAGFIQEGDAGDSLILDLAGGKDGYRKFMRSWKGAKGLN